MNKKTEWLLYIVGIFVVSSLAINIFEMKMIGWNDFALVGGGILFSGSLFLIMQVITEIWGDKLAKKITIFTAITCFVIMGIAQILVWLPGTYIENNEHFAFIMGQGIRIMSASMLALLGGQLLNIYVFSKIRSKTKNKESKTKFAITSTAITLIGQLVDNFMFVTLAFGAFGISSYEMAFKDIFTSVLGGTSIEMIVQALLVFPLALIVMKLKKLK